MVTKDDTHDVVLKMGGDNSLSVMSTDASDAQIRFSFTSTMIRGIEVVETEPKEETEVFQFFSLAFKMPLNGTSSLQFKTAAGVDRDHVVAALEVARSQRSSYLLRQRSPRKATAFDLHSEALAQRFSPVPLTEEGNVDQDSPTHQVLIHGGEEKEDVQLGLEVTLVDSGGSQHLIASPTARIGDQEVLEITATSIVAQQSPMVDRDTVAEVWCADDVCVPALTNVSTMFAGLFGVADDDSIHGEGVNGDSLVEIEQKVVRVLGSKSCYDKSESASMRSDESFGKRRVNNNLKNRAKNVTSQHDRWRQLQNEMLFPTRPVDSLHRTKSMGEPSVREPCEDAGVPSALSFDFFGQMTSLKPPVVESRFSNDDDELFYDSDPDHVRQRDREVVGSQLPSPLSTTISFDFGDTDLPDELAFQEETIQSVVNVSMS